MKTRIEKLKRNYKRADTDAERDAITKELEQLRESDPVAFALGLKEFEREDEARF